MGRRNPGDGKSLVFGEAESMIKKLFYGEPVRDRGANHRSDEYVDNWRKTKVMIASVALRKPVIFLDGTNCFPTTSGEVEMMQLQTSCRFIRDTGKRIFLEYP